MICVALNFLITYFYEKVVVQKSSLLWKKMKEKKRMKEAQKIDYLNQNADKGMKDFEINPKYN